MNEDQARMDLVEVCRLAYSRGYICGTEGNFSIRLSERVVLSTPRGTCKGRLKPEDLVLTDLDGQDISAGNGPKDATAGNSRVSTELPMHLAAYETRADVKAVVHAHPTVAVGFSVAGQSLAKCVLPEVVCTLGVIPTAPYATPSTSEVPDSIRDFIRSNDALIMDHHGALTVGSTIWEAFYRLETLEHHAQTMLVAHVLGGVKPLYSSQVKKLLEIRGIYGSTSPMPSDLMMSSICSQSDPEEGR